PPAPRPLSLPAQEDDEAPSQSALVSPLTLRNTSIGALALFDDADREWTDDDLSIIEAVSAQAALAVENARLIEETQRWALQLKTSAEISQVITASLDLNVLIGRSVNLIRRNFRFIATHLYLLNDGEGGAQTLLYQSDPDDDGDRPVTPRHISLNPDTLAGQAFRQQQTVVVQQNTPQHLSLLPAHPPGTQAALAIPLHVRQEAIGVLEIISDRPNPFTPDHVAVLEILATQVATSIGNARAYQEQQEVAEKLREVDRLKTQFLANMSHELRTPLNSIIGFSRVILKGIDGPLTELQKTDLTSIHQSGKHLLDLINNILDLAKIEAGKMELNFERVDLKPVLDAITATTIGLVKDKDIEVVEHVPDDLPLIEADETRVRQILLNLVSNAAKFTPQGRIVISARHTDRHVHIQVSDTGIGIAPEEQENIFKEFTQVDASTTRKAGGTGLGLPISRRFAELHGGTITVESRLNAGATFTLSLPIFQRPPDGTPPRPQATVAPAAEPASSTLLVIDGDPRVTDYYRQYLQNTGLDLVTLHTGEEALETVRTLQPKAILLDVLLPDTDGWSVLGALKENPHTAHIPVIICSIVEDHFRANQLGADGYLVKPILRQDLLGALEELDKRHRQLKRVLVIDDHADDVLLIRRILEAHECHVLEAANGMDGLDMLYANPPDLVILDLTMPQLDGFAVLDSMRDNPKTRHIPVIILTARDLTSEEESRLQAQADTILHKSTFADADLLQHVDRLLQPTPGT
ncbi:MAG: response regulator, partial [Caldilineae bacterium]